MVDDAIAWSIISVLFCSCLSVRMKPVYATQFIGPSKLKLKKFDFQHIIITQPRRSLAFRSTSTSSTSYSLIAPGNLILTWACRKFSRVYKLQHSLKNINCSKMIIYTDIISGDELLSDAYDAKLVDGVVYEADCAMVQVSSSGDVDIGGNPSAEDGADEDLEEGVETVNNVVYSFRLQNTQFDKKSFLTYIKGYMKRVKAHLAETAPEEVEVFEKGAQAYVKKVIGSFKDWDFFTGESMDPDGMIVLLNYREDGTTPFVAVWKHGVKAEKV